MQYVKRVKIQRGSAESRGFGMYKHLRPFLVGASFFEGIGLKRSAEETSLPF